MSHDFQTVVVGAGVVGLAAAYRLSQAGHAVLVVDQAADIGIETSSRNSEVIHAGLYNPPGSLKSKLCVEGRALLYEFCRASGVDTRRLGKLVVATNEVEAERLMTIFELAQENGVDDVVWLDGRQAMGLEPDLTCRTAFLSPSTGIVDSRGYMLALRGAAEAQGTILQLRTRVLGGECQPEGFTLRMAGEDHEVFALSCRNLVNAAGHGAHALAMGIDGFDHKCLPPRFLAKGSYCSVTGKSPFSRLVYPVPVPGALGIHVTIDLNGQARLGPDITWTDQLEYSVDQNQGPRFQQACSKYWPGIVDRELTPSYCGIRPKIHGPEQAFADFLVQGPAEHRVVGLVNLFGIESPGLTSSLAIARLIAEALDD